MTVIGRRSGDLVIARDRVIEKPKTYRGLTRMTLIGKSGIHRGGAETRRHGEIARIARSAKIAEIETKDLPQINADERGSRVVCI